MWGIGNAKALENVPERLIGAGSTLGRCAHLG